MKKKIVKVKDEGYGKLMQRSAIPLRTLDYRVAKLEQLLQCILINLEDVEVRVEVIENGLMGDKNGESKKRSGASPPVSGKRQRS